MSEPTGKVAIFGSNPPIEVPTDATDAEVRTAMESIFPELKNATMIVNSQGNYEFQPEFATKG